MLVDVDICSMWTRYDDMDSHNGSFIYSTLQRHPDHHTSWQLALHCHIDAPPLPTNSNSLTGRHERYTAPAGVWPAAGPGAAGTSAAQ
jgi:hypothetical protein